MSSQMNLISTITEILTEQWYNPGNWFDGDDAQCTDGKIKASSWSKLYSELVKRKYIEQGDKLIIVWGPSQTLYYTGDGKSLIKTFRVSTGANGFGNGADNKQTSTGLMKIYDTIDAEKYEVIVKKRPIGTILGPNKDSTRVDEKGDRHYAEVITGVLELDGLETCNKNTYSRGIFIHGTNRERELGSRRSNGCVRVSNDAIQWLLSNISVGTRVYIKS